MTTNWSVILATIWQIRSRFLSGEKSFELVHKEFSQKHVRDEKKFILKGFLFKSPFYLFSCKNQTVNSLKSNGLKSYK